MTLPPMPIKLTIQPANLHGFQNLAVPQSAEDNSLYTESITGKELCTLRFSTSSTLHREFMEKGNALRSVTILRWFTKLLCVCFCLCGHLYPQQDRGGLVVVITDASGAIVRDAAIIITNNDTGAEMKGATNNIGVWIANPLPAGDYSVVVEHEGFQKAVALHVTVDVQQATSVPIALVVGNVEQQLLVTAQTPLMQTEDSELGQTISGALKDELPVSDRDFNRLAVLTVGVNYSTPSGPRDSASGGFAANGVSQYQNNYVLDGTDNNSYDQNVNEGRTFALEPSLDAISEFRVESNSYSAEFGRDGGAVINVLTKSGTNEFHGSAYEYFQTSDFNANDYFNKALAIQKTDYTKNIFGAAAGGPIWLPFYDGHDGTFFFADFERQPYRSPGTADRGAIPTSAEAEGNFQGDALIYDPATGLPFPNNIIKSERINSVARSIAAAIPQTNLTSTATANYYRSDPNNADDDRIAVRVDHRLPHNDSLFGRYQYQGQSQPKAGLFAGTILSGDVNNTATSQGIVFGWTHTLGSSLMNESRFGWTRLNWVTSPTDAGRDINKEVGISGVPIQQGLNGALATINFNNSSLSSFGGSYAEQDLNGTYQGEDTLTWMHGRHSIKLGGMYRWVFFKSAASSFAPNGEFEFDGHYTANYINGSPVTGTGNAFADFLLDLPDQARISDIHTNDYQRRAYSFFIQDSFKLSAKLTVDLGLRWDYVTPVWEAHNRGAALNPLTRVLNIPGFTGTLPDAVERQIEKGIIILNTSSNRYFGIEPDHHDFGPRVGFNFLVTPLTVFRAGYGLYFGPEQLGPFGEPSPGFSVPFLHQDSVGVANNSPSTVNAITMSTGFPLSALSNPADPTLYAYAPNLRTPYIQQWNATVQRQLGSSSALDISYIGSKTTALYITQDWNLPSISVDGAVPYAQRQRFPGVDASGVLQSGSAIQGASNNGMGNYNALGIKFERHVRNGLSMIGAFTWSHDIDDITNSGLSVGNNGRASYPQLQLKLQHGNSDWDIAGRWVTGFQYELPLGRGKKIGSDLNRVANAFLGGWRMGGILTVESGPWYTVNQNYDSAHNGFICGTCKQRPDRVAGQNANRGPRQVAPNNSSVHWFNVNAFQQATDGTVGNEGRNTVVGPQFRNFDTSLAKVYNLSNEARFQIRIEAYNATNTTNFLASSGSTSPSGFSLGNSNFGDLTADRGGRTMQLACRFTF